jgi:hypothetical protein
VIFRRVRSSWLAIDGAGRLPPHDFEQRLEGLFGTGRILRRAKRGGDPEPVTCRATLGGASSRVCFGPLCVLAPRHAEALDARERREDDRERRLGAALPQPFVVSGSFDGCEELLGACPFRPPILERTHGPVIRFAEVEPPPRRQNRFHVR